MGRVSVEDDQNTVIVFDTNVLLTDPQALYAYPHAQIVIPETVLSELDKLKTAHVDPDLRFRGREVTRMIFELADGNSLVDGIVLPEGGSLRVAPFEYNNQALPEGFSTKTPDDKILATAWLLADELGDDHCLTLLTNDLNMLLKAQTAGLTVSQFGKGNDISFGKRYIIRPFQRYRVPLTILFLAVALFAAAVVIANAQGGLFRARSTAVSEEFQSLLTADQKAAYNALVSLQNNPNDTDAMLTLAQFYYDRASQSQVNGDSAAMIVDAKNGITYFTQYLTHFPNAADAQTDRAVLYYFSGNYDRAIQEALNVLELNPNHVKANYNLGIFYVFGQTNLDQALKQMQRVVELTKNATTNEDKAAREKALKMIDLIRQRQESEGTTATAS